MAKQGKGGDLRSQLGSLFRSTLQQLDTVREVVVQKSREGRIQLDLTLLRRRRKAALADLGEVVAELAASGRLDEDDFPELSGPLSRLEAVDEQIESAERRARGVPDEVDEGPPRWRRARQRDEAPVDDDGDREEYDEDEDAERADAGARRGEGRARGDDVDDVVDDDVDDVVPDEARVDADDEPDRTGDAKRRRR